MDIFYSLLEKLHLQTGDLVLMSIFFGFLIFFSKAGIHFLFESLLGAVFGVLLVFFAKTLLLPENLLTFSFLQKYESLIQYMSISSIAVLAIVFPFSKKILIPDVSPNTFIYSIKMILFVCIYTLFLTGTLSLLITGSVFFHGTAEHSVFQQYSWYLWFSSHSNAFPYIEKYALSFFFGGMILLGYKFILEMILIFIYKKIQSALRKNDMKHVQVDHEEHSVPIDHESHH